MNTRATRWAFLRQAGCGGAGFLLLNNARLAFAYEANDKLNLAGIGVGGQGRGNLDQFSGLGQSIVALCDVDRIRAGWTL